MNENELDLLSVTPIKAEYKPQADFIVLQFINSF